jgi:hypothetical protein
MGARVFISHRPADGAGVAIALAEELDGLFGDGQIVRIGAHRACEERWRDALAGTLDGPPILLAVVSPGPASGVDGPEDWALQEQLAAALAHGGLILPLLTDWRSARADAALPAPFERLSRLPRLPLRQAEWTGDVARLGEDLRGLGLRPLAGTQPGTMPLPPSGRGTDDDADAARERAARDRGGRRRRRAPRHPRHGRRRRTTRRRLGRAALQQRRARRPVRRLARSHRPARRTDLS